MFQTTSAQNFSIGVAVASAALLTAANYVANHAIKRPARLAYTTIVVFLFGTLVPAFALRALIDAGLTTTSVAAATPVVLAALAVGLAFLLLSVREEPASQRQRLPKLLVALFAPSLAEVLIFVGIVFNIAEFLLKPWLGAVLATAASVIVTSLSFGLYHFTHAAPWNSVRVVRVLLVVWLFVGLAYVVTGNLWATALVNTCMASVGFVKNRVTRPEEQSFAASLMLDVLAIAVVALIVFSQKTVLG